MDKQQDWFTRPNPFTLQLNVIYLIQAKLTNDVNIHNICWCFWELHFFQYNQDLKDPIPCDPIF